MGLLFLLVLLVFALVATLPMWPHSQRWGYYPGGGVGLVVLIIVVLISSGRL